MSNMKSVYGSKKENYIFKQRVKSIILFIWFLILAVICVLPLIMLLLNSSREKTDIALNGFSFIPGDHLFKNLKTLFKDPDYNSVFMPLYGFRNSAFQAVCATVLAIFFSCLTAYGIQIYDFKIKEAAYMAILIVMMVPMQVTSAGFVTFMRRINLDDSYVPLIIPALASPAIVYFMRSYMKSSFPADIVEAARIDGCSELRTFVQIAMPMMKPAVAVQSIFAFIAQWNNFYTPNLILLTVPTKSKTLPMMISGLGASDILTDLGVNYTAIAISIIPIVIVYLILSKFIIGGVALGGVKE